MNYRNERRTGKYLSVGEVNEYVKLLLDSDAVLSGIAVRGEISNFKRHYSGHLYFSLKDASGTIKCVMFASSAAGLPFDPADGNDVIAYGRISVFPRDGVYQLYVSAMQNAGLGDLYAAFERLKAKLQAEGLFAPERKKPIPPYPRTVGIITSATGAAIQDLLNVTGRRYPAADILLYPALVQGPEAAASVAAGIRYFNRHKNADVLIIGRGGGSFEDLSCFNDEALARTIAASDIPVISAVGHETDFTIADFAADLRAPTPSAAAELAVPDAQELLAGIRAMKQRLKNAAVKLTETCRVRLGHLAASSVLSSPERALDAKEERAAQLAQRLDSSFSAFVAQKEGQFSAECAKLEALSPLAVLARGYAIVEKDGKAVPSADGLRPGDGVVLRFKTGTAEAQIKGVNNDE